MIHVAGLTLTWMQSMTSIKMIQWQSYKLILSVQNPFPFSNWWRKSTSEVNSILYLSHVFAVSCKWVAAAERWAHSCKSDASAFKVHQGLGECFSCWSGDWKISKVFDSLFSRYLSKALDCMKKFEKDFLKIFIVKPSLYCGLTF